MVASKLEISFSWGLFSGAMMLVSGRVGKKVLTCICWRLRNHQILHHLGTPNDFGEIVMVIVILIIQNTAVILLSFNGCLCWFVVFSSSNWNRLSSRSSNLWSQPEINNSAIIKGSWYNHPFVQYTNWNHHEYTWVLFFIPFCWKGNYSPLPQQLPQCFRDHSASFRDTHFTFNPSASFRGLVFLIFASATAAPLRFPRFLVVVGFISFHFGLLGLHFLSFGLFLLLHSFALGLDTFWRHRQGVLLFGRAFLPRCFREASARLPQNTEAKPVIKPTKRSDLAILHPKIKFQYGTWKLSYIRIVKFYLLIPHCALPTSPSATFREGHPSAKLPRPSAAWTLCIFNE